MAAFPIYTAKNGVKVRVVLTHPTDCIFRTAEESGIDAIGHFMKKPRKKPKGNYVEIVIPLKSRRHIILSKPS